MQDGTSKTYEHIQNRSAHIVSYGTPTKNTVYLQQINYNHNFRNKLPQRSQHCTALHNVRKNLAKQNDRS